MKKIPGRPGTSPELPWHPEDPLGTLLGPQGCPWDLHARPWDPLETSLSPPRDAPGTPGDLQ